MNYFRRLRDAAICVALLAIPFLFLNSNLKKARSGTDISFLDRLVLQASAPIQYVATEAAQSVSAVLEEYVYLVDVKEDNSGLRAELARLQQENRELRVQARENRRLRRLLGIRESINAETLSAKIIGKEVSDHFRVVRIVVNRGERDRIKPGMPVVSTEGLVGQIRRNWNRYSDVLLTVDRTSKIDVLIPGTGARGILRGTGAKDYVCRIQYLKRGDVVSVGDEIYTSGFGKRFPPSILVGRVSHIRDQEVGLYQEVEVEPAVDFSSLEEVLVLTQGSRAADAEDPFGADDEAP